MHATMKADIATHGDVLRVRVTGSVDVDTSPQLRTEVQQAWHPGLTRLELDFTDVDYISSPGIALLLEFRHNLAKENVAFALVAASPRVREVLATCRLEGMFLGEGNGETHVPAAG